MKKILLLSGFLFFTLTSFAQCNQFYKIKEGTYWHMSNFDAKGKLLGKTIQKVDTYEETSNGFKATLEITSLDKKGEQTFRGSSTIKCEDGIIYFDMNDMFPEEQMQSIQEFEITVDGTNLQIPKELKVGEYLEDAEVSMHIEASPIKMNFKINVTERKVEAQEELNTPAGKFECFKISQNIYMKTLGKMEMSSKEWYSPEVGMVKSESYNKKGKMSGYSLLTAYNY